MRRTTILLASVLLVAGIGTACSSDNASVPPAKSVEKSTAIDGGDALCASVATDQQQLVNDFKGKYPQATADQARDFQITTMTPRLEKFVGDFHLLGEPTKDKADWDKLVRNLDGDLSTYKSNSTTDPVALLATKPFAGDAPAFAAYGFKKCQTALA